MNLVVGVARNGVIGQGLKIPWRYPVDLRWFKALTMGGTLVMGRKTFESLPKRGLPGRDYIVVSTTGQGLPNQVPTLEDAEYLARSRWPTKTCWVIGGAQLYVAAKKAGLVESLYVTEIPETPPIDSETVLLPLDFFQGYNLVESFSDDADFRLTHKVYTCRSSS